MASVLRFLTWATRNVAAADAARHECEAGALARAGAKAGKIAS